MGCKIAENKPLQRLADDLGLARQCHSMRGDCMQSLQRANAGKYAMSSAGAVMGYCQGLFYKSGNPEKHTQNIIEWLKDIDAPHYMSHELLWNNRTTEKASEYIQQAMEPLLGEGRVPVIITELDPATQGVELQEIFQAAPPLYNGETMLVRVQLNSDESIRAIAIMMNEIIRHAQTEKKMPALWPLIQGNFTSEKWNMLKELLGTNWEYTNIAVTPFTNESTLKMLKSQVTVAQFFIGKKEDINDNGQIQISSDMCIGGVSKTQRYDIVDYTKRLADNSLSPTCIICGPSLKEWDISYNKERVAKYTLLFRKATKHLWTDLSEKKMIEVLALTA